jgi:hypothetical protein
MSWLRDALIAGPPSPEYAVVSSEWLISWSPANTSTCLAEDGPVLSKEKTRLEAFKEKMTWSVAGRIAMAWISLVAVARGAVDVVRDAVAIAIATEVERSYERLSSPGGVIFAQVDNVREENIAKTSRHLAMRKNIGRSSLRFQTREVVGEIIIRWILIDYEVK